MNNVQCFTRMRLQSHRLKIETGRWSRQPVENRLCECGAVQTEEHVLTTCPKIENIRNRFTNVNFSDITAVFADEHAFEICYEVLNVFID